MIEILLEDSCVYRTFAKPTATIEMKSTDFHSLTVPWIFISWFPQKSREQFKKCSCFYVWGSFAHLVGLLWPARVVRSSWSRTTQGEVQSHEHQRQLRFVRDAGSWIHPRPIEWDMLHMGPEIRILILKLWSPPKSGNHGVLSDFSFCFCGEVPQKFDMPSQGKQFKFKIPN